MIDKLSAERLKAFIVANFMGIANHRTDGGCETCGWGGTHYEEVDLEGALSLVDDFLASEDNK
jgi:hypothetical protein